MDQFSSANFDANNNSIDESENNTLNGHPYYIKLAKEHTANYETNNETNNYKNYNSSSISNGDDHQLNFIPPQMTYYHPYGPKPPQMPTNLQSNLQLQNNLQSTKFNNTNQFCSINSLGTDSVPNWTNLTMNKNNVHVDRLGRIYKFNSTMSNLNTIQEDGTSRQRPIDYAVQSVVNARMIDQPGNLQHVQVPCIPNNPTSPYHINFINVELIDKPTWKTFFDVGNEMIITKSGRRTFPYLSIRVTGLMPNVKYSIQVGVEQINPIRWKYSEGQGWSPSKHEMIENNSHFVEHIESGKSGDLLEGKILTFKYIKLTNHPSNKETHFVLKSMHLYNFRIIVASILPGNVYYVLFNNYFDQTCFFAVTAYQNKMITRLKIERNPYAKGFLTTDRNKQTQTGIKHIIKNEEQNNLNDSGIVIRKTPTLFSQNESQENQDDYQS